MIESTDSFADAKSSNKKVVWNEDDREKWLGAVPKVRKKKKKFVWRENDRSRAQILLKKWLSAVAKVAL